MEGLCAAWWWPDSVHADTRLRVPRTRGGVPTALGYGCRMGMLNRRAVHAGLVLGCVLGGASAVTTSARAAPEPRQGVYASGALGGAYGRARFSDGHNSGTSSGAGAQLRGAFGLGVVDGLAVAAELRLLLHGGEAQLAPLDDRSVLGAGFIVAGVLVDYYPAPLGPLHVQLGLGLTSVSPTGESASGVMANGTEGSPVSEQVGAFGHAGVGYAWRSDGGLGFGPVLDMYAARASRHSATCVAYGVALELVLSSF